MKDSAPLEPRRRPTAPGGAGTLSVIAFLALTAVGVVRIVLTYPVFFQTCDEPHHIACGMEWFDSPHLLGIEHPPLARVAAAAVLHARGFRSSGSAQMDAEGNRILRSAGKYEANLAEARAGILPFFVLASWVVWSWTRRLFGDRAAVAAVLLFTTLPPILAHSGLATTDAALAACFPLAVYALVYWLDEPDGRRSLLLGGAAGLSVLSKFSAIVFLPASAVAIFALRVAIERPPRASWRRRLGPLVRGACLAAAVAFLVVWAGYRFSMTPLTGAERRPHHVGLSAVDRALARGGPLARVGNSMLEMPLPAGELLLGINRVREHDRHGHPAFLLGRIRRDGWWYFFPVAIAVKTPLAFLALAAAGALFLGKARERDWKSWAPLLAAASVLAVCMASRINIGLRHALAVYPFLAIVAGRGVAGLLEARRARLGAALVGVALVSWQLVSSALAHPDYLAYFNEIAARHPERFLVDSDLDWGQDLWRLAARLRDVHADSVSLAYFGSESLDGQGLPPYRNLVPYEPATGWVAVSECSRTIDADQIRRESGKPSGPYDWLEGRPYTRVGRSIRLYDIRPASP